MSNETLSEAAVINQVKLEASSKNIKLWRNNVGAVYSADTNTFIRFGLANESAKMNAHIKSGDLIGIRPVLITQDMVGQVIGQFVSREIKHSNWRYAGTEREVAQQRWIDLIRSMGGDAAFATKQGTL